MPAIQEGRYFTVTGNADGYVKPIEIRTAELQAIHDKYLLPVFFTGVVFLLLIVYSVYVMPVVLQLRIETSYIGIRLLADTESR